MDMTCKFFQIQVIKLSMLQDSTNKRGLPPNSQICLARSLVLMGRDPKLTRSHDDRVKAPEG